MSRLGKQPIVMPEKTEATYASGVFSVQGPKGKLSRAFADDVTITVAGPEVTLTPARQTKLALALWGTYAAHIKNMIQGVTAGYTKVLQIEGVGYRAEVKGKDIVMQLGFSHPVSFAIPEGIAVTVEKSIMTISGIDKDAVGQFAANIRAMKKPEPYKGKGIRYKDEFIIRKQGKKAV